jgi:hypothetical protein
VSFQVDSKRLCRAEGYIEPQVNIQQTVVCLPLAKNAGDKQARQLQQTIASDGAHDQHSSQTSPTVVDRIRQRCKFRLVAFTQSSPLSLTAIASHTLKRVPEPLFSSSNGRVKINVDGDYLRKFAYK